MAAPVWDCRYHDAFARCWAVISLSAASVGEGSTFTIRVPALLPGIRCAETLAEVTPVTTDAELEAIRATGAGRTILVIDDDPEARDIVERFLRKDGFKL